MDDLRIVYSDKVQYPRAKKRIFLIVGLLILIISIVILCIELLSPEVQLSQLIVAIANMLLGIYFILNSVEHNFLNSFSYILITPEFIQYKHCVFCKTNIIEWPSIERVSMNKNSLLFQTNNQSIRLKMIHYTSSDEKKIRSRISLIAESLGKEIA